MSTIIVAFAEEDRVPFIGHADRALRPQTTLILGRSDHVVQLYTVRSVEPVEDDGSFHVLVGYPFPAPQIVAARYWTKCQSAEIITTMTDPTLDPELIDQLDDATLRAAYQRTGGTPGDAQADAIRQEIERRGLNV